MIKKIWNKETRRNIAGRLSAFYCRTMEMESGVEEGREEGRKKESEDGSFQEMKEVRQ